MVQRTLDRYFTKIVICQIWFYFRIEFKTNKNSWSVSFVLISLRMKRKGGITLPKSGNFKRLRFGNYGEVHSASIVLKWIAICWIFNFNLPFFENNYFWIYTRPVSYHYSPNIFEGKKKIAHISPQLWTTASDLGRKLKSLRSL